MRDLLYRCTARSESVAIPLWTLALASAILPFSWALRAWYRRRIRVRAFPIRCPLAFLSAFSLLLCISLFILWVASYWMDYWASKPRASFPAPVWPWRGSLCFGKLSAETPATTFFGLPPGALQGPPQPVPHSPLAELYAHPSSDWQRYPAWTILGFGEERGAVVPPGGFAANGILPRVVIPYRIWLIPFWFPTAITAILPSMWAFRTLRARWRIRRGLCHNCRYDLRASPERCPECGEPKRTLPPLQPPTWTFFLLTALAVALVHFGVVWFLFTCIHDGSNIGRPV